MSFDSEKRSEQAVHQNRGTHGQFTSSDQSSVTSSEKGATNVISGLFKTEQGTDDSTIIDVKVTNPLHKIAQALQDLKNKQTTTFDLKFTIPLIALPVFLLAAFSLGRAQIACVPQFSSKVGVIKVVSVMSPKSQPGFLSIFASLFPSLPNILPSKDLELTTRDLLIPTTGDPMTIIHDADIVLLPYANHPAVITGNISTCTNSITLDNAQNLTQTE